ncbi:MAG: gdhB 1 [Chthoniobacteraceae bacterium]|nr:gdhB 1 [Chthoniobacteraceae bacterium]
MRTTPRLFPVAFFLAAAAASAAPQPPPPDYRFKVETFVEGIPQPMQVKIAPDGRVFFNEYGGKLKICHPDTKQLVEAGQLEVWAQQENGFLGFALDPEFAANGFIYCLYSPPNFPGQHLSRFTMKGDVLDPASEKLILKFEEQRKECCHHAGSVEFGPDGSLYFSAGDNTHPFGDSASYAPIDTRPGREPWDAQKSASNTNSLNGKILRIRIRPDATYEIPAGNLFPPGTPKTRPEIFVMGCRNPWRIAIDQKTGYLYWGEVGPDANDDGPRGSRGYDEINQARKAGNFGWPYFVGKNFPYAAYDFVAKQIGPKFDPLHPFNESPNNTGLRDLPPAQPAFIYWPYGESPEFPMLGKGGRTACAGPVFHYEAAFEKSGGFPAYFDNCLLFSDWQRPFIKWARLDKDSNLEGIESFTSAVVNANAKEQVDAAAGAIAQGATLVKRVVSSVFGKDGCLYLLDYGETWGANKDAKLLRISYQRGNLAPIAKAGATQSRGREPLTVSFSSNGSADQEGAALSFEWRLQPGDKIFSKEPNPQLTISEPGNYRAELRVSDPEGATGIASVALIVGNSAPEVKFEYPANGDFFTPGKPIAYRVNVNDVEDGASLNKPDEFGIRTLVSAAVKEADGKDSANDPGLTLMKQSDCFNCHAIEQKVVGPPLLEVAAKYRGQPAALEASVQRVINGSTGVWGQVPMLAHPQHTADEIHIMLRWVFGLEKGKGGPAIARGLSGEITAPSSDKAASFVLEATYTDAGRAPAGSLSGKAAVTLRPRRIEAITGELHGPAVLGHNLGAIDDGHSVRLADINLADVGSVTVRASSGNVGGKIEFRTGAKDGALIGSVEVPNTGGWDKWIEARSEPGTAIPPGRADIFLVFVNPGKGGLMNLDWVQFNPR